MSYISDNSEFVNQVNSFFSYIIKLTGIIEKCDSGIVWDTCWANSLPPDHDYNLLENCDFGILKYTLRDNSPPPEETELRNEQGHIIAMLYRIAEVLKLCTDRAAYFQKSCSCTYDFHVFCDAANETAGILDYVLNNLSEQQAVFALLDKFLDKAFYRIDGKLQRTGGLANIGFGDIEIYFRYICEEIRHYAHELRDACYRNYDYINYAYIDPVDNKPYTLSDFLNR